MRSRDFRRIARESLGGIFSGNWLNGVLSYFLYGIILSAASSILGPFGVIATGPLTVGLCTAFLGFVRRQNTDAVSSLFVAFNDRFITNALTGLVHGFFVTIGFFFFFFPGIIVYYMLSMTYYVRADKPDISLMDAMRESARLMKGKKWKLFKLHFSFIGWYFVVMLFTFGIGIYWLIPYVQSAEAAFYNSLVSEPVEYGSSYSHSSYSAPEPITIKKPTPTPIAITTPTSSEEPEQSKPQSTKD